VTREDLERLIAQAPPEDLPRLVGDFEAARAAAWSRMLAPRALAADSAQDQNLSVEEAASRLGVSKDYLYRHADRLPFALRIGRKLLFSARGLEKWNAQKQRR
jgi:excisionase family DNA binding protein